jgi:hypothetical protein
MSAADDAMPAIGHAVSGGIDSLHPERSRYDMSAADDPVSTFRYAVSGQQPNHVPVHRDGVSNVANALSRDANTMSATINAVSADGNGMSAADNAVSADTDTVSGPADAMFASWHNSHAVSALADAVSADRDSMPSRSDHVRLELADAMSNYRHRLSPGANFVRLARFTDTLPTTADGMRRGPNAMSAGHDAVSDDGNTVSPAGNQMPAGDDPLPGGHHGMSELPNAVPVGCYRGMYEWADVDSNKW